MFHSLLSAQSENTDLEVAARHKQTEGELHYMWTHHKLTVSKHNFTWKLFTRFHAHLFLRRRVVTIVHEAANQWESMGSTAVVQRAPQLTINTRDDAFTVRGVDGISADGSECVDLRGIDSIIYLLEWRKTAMNNEWNTMNTRIFTKCFIFSCFNNKNLIWKIFF